MKAKDCAALILAGGEGKRLAPLTNERAKPCVSFGGCGRIIDLTLSNCRNSGVPSIGVLTQYKSSTLEQHLQDGQIWIDPSHHEGRMTLLPSSPTHPYRGTADAIYQNIDYIDQMNPRNVLILSGDHIYQMDYRRMLEVHQLNNAAVTVAVQRTAWSEASRFGIISTDEQGRMLDFTEKPDKPKSNLASMGIYLFDWPLLKEILIEDAGNHTSDHDFGKDIVPYMLKRKEAIFTYNYNGYWRDVGTLESLWQANMDLLNGRIDPNHSEWPLWTTDMDCFNITYHTSFTRIENSIAHPDNYIEGEVYRSVLARGVMIGRGSEVKNSVIMPDVSIGDNVSISHAIIGEGAVIQAGAVIENGAVLGAVSRDFIGSL